MKKSSALVLLSGGLDSSVNLLMALGKFKHVEAVTFLYGQKAARRELHHAKKQCQRYGVRHHVIELPFIGAFGGSSLTTAKKIPTGKMVRIDDLKTSQKTAKSVWVPNRNGILLNVAAGLAESLGIQVVVPGFNKEEATTFPDNTKEYMNRLNGSFALSTANKVRVECFTVSMKKPEIAKRGQKLGLMLSDLWPCYGSGKKWCGQCESCQRTLRALKGLAL
ncbi:MAG: 7-cyano-7-deazaguanine synthase QueC [Proteobacteria bacterium]|jgi:7-cyano-7-deazaguanine synthase|nr:7-cyano-7-deazaguanine synthase QueC [Pseudomonadota bacterium]